MQGITSQDPIWLDEATKIIKEFEGMYREFPYLCPAGKATIGFGHVITKAEVPFMERITLEPGKRGGRPCIRGLRISVYDVLSMHWSLVFILYKKYRLLLIELKILSKFC